MQVLSHDPALGSTIHLVIFEKVSPADPAAQQILFGAAPAPSPTRVIQQATLTLALSTLAVHPALLRAPIIQQSTLGSTVIWNYFGLFLSLNWGRGLMKSWNKLVQTLWFEKALGGVCLKVAVGPRGPYGVLWAAGAPWWVRVTEAVTCWLPPSGGVGGSNGQESCLYSLQLGLVVRAAGSL